MHLSMSVGVRLQYCWTNSASIISARILDILMTPVILSTYSGVIRSMVVHSMLLRRNPQESNFMITLSYSALEMKLPFRGFVPNRTSNSLICELTFSTGLLAKGLLAK